ncbi:MAG: YqgE/AlgH family protein [Alphaproteobacteria bacterium]|nr:YqgE/AlgH family protein [Alphaproteobacteria bacterium]
MRRKTKHKRFSFRLSNRALGFLLAGAVLLSLPFFLTHGVYTGQILAADARMQPPFDKSLVLLTRHGFGGTMGVVLNKPLSGAERQKLSRFLRDTDIPVFYGGPLGSFEKILVLEQKPQASGDARFELKDWDEAVRAAPDLLTTIRRSLQRGETRYKIFTGFAGWAPFQLEAELHLHKLWQVVAPTPDLIFHAVGPAPWEKIEKQEKEKQQLRKSKQT